MLGIECQICQISLQFGAQWKRFDFFCHCPTMFKSHSASSNQPTTTGWHWAGPSGKPAARTICFRFLAKPRCAVKCIPFTQPAFSLLKLLVLQVKLSFPNSGGAIILMEQGFKKREKKRRGKKEKKLKGQKKGPPTLPPLQTSFVKVVDDTVCKFNCHVHGFYNFKGCFIKNYILLGKNVYVSSWALI